MYNKNPFYRFIFFHFFINLYTYLQSRKDFEEYKDNFIETFPINELGKYNFRDNNYYILRPNDSYGGEGINYVKNEEELQKQFDIAHNFQTSTRGIKVRGSYPTQQEAELRAKMLSIMIDYYSIHLQMFNSPKSIHVFNEVFK